MLVNYHLESIYNDSYRGYVRQNRKRILGNSHNHLKDALDIQTNQTILIVGAGFGWLVEEWIKMGLGPICATDISTYIQTNKHLHSTIEIYPYDVNTHYGSDAIVKMLGKVDWAISENVMPVLRDEEAVQLAYNMNKIATKTAHYIQCSAARDMFFHNWKSIETWQKILPKDIMVEYER